MSDGILTLKEDDLRRAAADGLRKAVDDALRSSYQYGDRFKGLLTKTVHEMEPEIADGVKAAFRAALASPGFQAACRDSLLKGVHDKFGGAFQGVLQAMAKQLANTPEIQEAVKDVVSRSLAGGLK